MTAPRVAGRTTGSPPAPGPWLLYDAVLAVGVALTLSLLISAGVGDTRPDAWAYLWAVGLGALMFVRRAYPTLVVALTVVGFIAYYAAGYTPIGVAAPVAAAVFSAAESARLAAAIGGSVAVVAVSVTYRLAAGQDPAFVLGYDLPQNLLALAAAVALGDSIRSRREVQRQSARIAALTAEQFRREADERLTAERLATSRDLHDSIGHSLAVISLHTEVAREAAAQGEAARALEVIRTTASGAMSDLRRTVADLRRGDQPHHTQGDPLGDTLGLAAIDAAIEPARAAGISVTVVNDVPAPLPSAVETAVFRVVQESITNIVRHSSATEASVRIEAGGGTVRVRVADNGPATSTAPAGHGLLGMRERVEGLGGRLATRRTEPGFEVDATLPWEGP